MKAFLVSVPTAAETLEIAAALLDEGVRPQDLSVILDEDFGDRLSDSGPTALRGRIDEDLIVERQGRDDLTYAATHNPEMEPAIEASRQVMEPLFESEVGGGISTASPRDSVSAVEEMDEASEFAEELLHPTGARDVRTHGPRSFSELDAEDIAGTVANGTTGTSIHGFEAGLGVGVLAALIPAVVPGVGVVLGDGDLASDLLGEEDLAIEEGLAPFLRRQGVPEPDVLRLESLVAAKGGVLEVLAASGEASARQIERILGANAHVRTLAIDIP